MYLLYISVLVMYLFIMYLYCSHPVRQILIFLLAVGWLTVVFLFVNCSSSQLQKRVNICPYSFGKDKCVILWASESSRFCELLKGMVSNP